MRNMRWLQKLDRDDNRTRERYISHKARDRGGIGRRASLRSWWGNPWGFESLRSHWPPSGGGYGCWSRSVGVVKAGPVQIPNQPPPSSTSFSGWIIPPIQEILFKRTPASP